MSLTGKAAYKKGQIVGFQQADQAEAENDTLDIEDPETVAIGSRNQRGKGRWMAAVALVCGCAVVLVVMTSSSNGVRKRAQFSQTSTTLVQSSEDDDPYSNVQYYRKEIRTLTDQELDDYFDAVWAMKTIGRQDGRGYLNYYDDFVGQHALAASNETVDQAHLYAAFTVWHSLLTYEFEIAIRSINPNVSIPYWDWTLDSADPSKTAILTEKYFGRGNASNGYIIDNGYVAYFPITTDYSKYVWWTPSSGYLRSEQNYNLAPYITRYDGEQETKLPTTTEWDACLDKTEFNSFWICMWGSYGTYEDSSLLHAGVHEYAGGDWDVMDAHGVDQIATGDFFDSNTSPNDPLWWSHHANLDRLWYQWNLQTGDALATDDDACGIFYGGAVDNPQPVGHNLWDAFAPPFYAFRTIDEIKTLGGLTINEACYGFHPSRLPYGYQ